MACQLAYSPRYDSPRYYLLYLHPVAILGQVWQRQGLLCRKRFPVHAWVGHKGQALTIGRPAKAYAAWLAA